MRPLLILLCALAVALAAAPAGALTLPPEGLTVGIQDDQLPVAPLDQLDARMDLVRDSGAPVTRVDVLWNDVAPTRPAAPGDDTDPAYRWARYDRIIDGLTARHVLVLLTIYRTPAWALDPANVPADPPDPERWAPDPAALGDFAHALAHRYDGTLHGRVTAFEPWNEPNIPFFLRPQWVRDPATASGWRPISAELYAGMLRAAYSGIRSAQPDATVVGVSGAPNGGGGPPTGPDGFGSVPNTTFMAALAVLQPPMDVASQHIYPALAPFQSTAFPSFNTIPALLADLDAIRPGIPLWITEFGYMTHAPASRPNRAFVSEAAQALYVGQAVQMMAAHPRVQLAIWFNMQDNPEWPGGLRRGDGSPKPAWDAFVALPKLVGPVPASPSAPG
ncbi:MAG: hypothetical protein U0Y82_01325 [Thermoleophilia bacterium]